MAADGLEPTRERAGIALVIGLLCIAAGGYLIYDATSATASTEEVDAAVFETDVSGVVDARDYRVHAVSYRVNFVGDREYERAGPVTLMVEPYRRVFVLHVTVVSGAFGVALVGSPVGALVVMVVVKTLLDLRGHWQEHDRARQRTLDPSPAA